MIIGRVIEYDQVEAIATKSYRGYHVLVRDTAFASYGDALKLNCFRKSISVSRIATSRSTSVLQA